ncbi:ABC transporter substrate-binding protein [Sulfobacillus thermosulfidooxidans]|uniref:ABC transporter substrate-binding protein n=1 Tax=Sulfobacillus thermosulfidooxidans TaxID=28034 RepID=UPI00042A810F|nr:ABC transporter substrate-binding protein [Sulfobacillus thermosulfidooxidans]
MKKAIGMVLVASIGVMAAGCGASPTQSAASGTFTTIDESHGITVGAPLNPFNSNGNNWLSFDQMQLGWSANSATNPNAFYPGLAKKWTISNGGRTVTVWLQKDAKWSNGKPVTAEDVKASMAAAFTQGNAQAFYLGSVKIISPTEIQFNQVPGQNYNLFFNNLMQQPIIPSFEYDKVLGPNIWTIINESLYTGSNPAKKALASKAETELTNLGKKVAAFSPAKDISAGPFVLKNLNPGEALLVKNPDFYDAQNIHVKQVVFRNYTGNQQIWNYLIAGQLDMAPFTAMPTNILNQILKTKGNQKVVAPAYVAAALAFNQGIYPYGIPNVRYALAHIINRQAVQKVAEPVVGTVSKYSDGMVDAATEKWLTSAQIKQLNPYNYNLTEATHELEKAGFKKVNGQWMMPNGKPWTATIYTVNGFSDWIEAAKVISSEMTAFGIPTQPAIVSSYSEYLKNIALDKYAIGFWLNALGPEAYPTFQRIWGSDDGYNVVGGQLVHYSYSNKTEGNWLDAPRTVKLPNGQVIDPGRLTYALNNLTPSEQRPIVQKLALAANVSLPMITLWNYINVQFINTNRFTDFPVNNPGLLNNPPGVWMMEGYVKPK